MLIWLYVHSSISHFTLIYNRKTTAMKNNKHLIHHFVAYIFCAAMVLLGSCKEKTKSGDTAMAAPIQEFRMNCVTLTKAQVQAWVDSGWTMPGDPGKIRSLLFQFYTPSGENAATNMSLTVYPGNTWSNVKITGRTNLAIDTTCVPLKLTGKTILANNVANLNSLKIIKADGTLNDFDFVRFRPVKVDGEYVGFEMEVVKVVGGKETLMSKDETYPCPPHCPPADPEMPEE
jgi:hypothetical protein